MKIQLIEMGLSRADAIEKCSSLGERFIEHFIKTAQLGKDDINFNHHCHEMQVWLDSVKKIRLAGSNKPIKKIDLINWFFTTGSNIEELVPPHLEDLYNDFIIEIMQSGSKVKDVFEKLL